MSTESEAEQSEPADQAPKGSLMLRAGTRMFRRWSRKLGDPNSLDEIHILNDQEQDRLRSIEKAAIWRAAGIGTLSALICAVSWPAALWCFGTPPEEMPMLERWPWYAVMGAVLTFATIVEIVLIYWNALHAVHRMSYAAGLKLFNDAGEPVAVMNALVSAALELPRSREETLFAVPGKEISRWWVLAAAMLYRLKVTVSYYIAKAIFQRLMSRVAVRWAIELVAVPVYAFWDALITFWVLREARVCAMGPSAVEEFSRKIQLRDVNVSDQAHNAIVCAVGATVARNSELHPNVELLFRELVKIYGIPPGQDVDSSDSLMGLLAGLTHDEQVLVLETLTLSMIIDGQASVWERQLLADCLDACGMPENPEPLKNGLKDFRAGKRIDMDKLIPAWI